MRTSSRPRRLLDAARSAWGLSWGVATSLALLNLGFFMAVGALVAHPLGSQAVATAVAAAATSAVLGSALVALLARSPFQYSSASSSVAVLYTALAVELARQPGASLASIWASLSLAVVLMGVLLLVSARLRLADVVRFLPAPVSAGFITGIGLLVVWSQVGPLLGISVRLQGLSLAALWAAFKPGALLVGAAAALVVYLFKRFEWRGPAHVVAVLVGVALHHLLALAGVDVGPTLGSIHPVATQLATASGLWSTPPGSLLGTLRTVLPYVAFMVLQALMNAAVVSAATTGITGQVVNLHRTVRAEGVANIVCGLLGALPVCTNSTITLAAARQASRWQAVAASALIVFVIVFLVGGALVHVPIAALAGTLVMSGFGLVDGWARRLARTAVRSRGRHRLVMSNLGVVAAVVAAFFFGSVPLALFIGLVLATVLLAVHLSRATRTTLEDASRQASLRVWPAPQATWLAEHRHSISIVRPRGELFFGTAEQLGRAMASVAPAQSHCIVDMSRLTTLDASGCQLLSAGARRLQAQGTRTLIAGFDYRSPEGQTLVTLGLDHPAAEGWWPDMDHALEQAETDLLQRAGLGVGSVGALAVTPLMNGLNETEVRQVLGLLVPRGVAPGRLFASGDPARSMFLVGRGRVEISVRSTQTSKTTRLASFGPGSIFGEISLLSTGVRTADAWCVESCDLLELTREALDTLMQQDPRLHAQILRNLGVHLANRLVIATATIEALQ